MLGERDVFRKALLITTALVIASSLSFLAPQSRAFEGRVTPESNRDRNGEFLCTYGFLDVSTFYSLGSSLSLFSAWTHIAVPIIGKGKVITDILVREESGPGSRFRRFFTGIYSNTSKGVPGKLIAGNWHGATSRCKETKVKISPTMLATNTTYWVEEMASPSLSSYYADNVAMWAVDPKTNRRAYKQTHSGHSGHSSHTSPWTPLSTGPCLQLR
jgi:hypothetical protein